MPDDAADEPPAVAVVAAGAAGGRRGSAARGLALSCHPLPSLAVTVIAALFAVAAGAGWPRWLLVGAAVLVGQLSIGWSNDWVDASRDTVVARTDKPLATGAIQARAVGAAALAALAATVPLSFALGVRAGSAHLVAVLGGWAYNLGLKSTLWSWLPYAVFFGLLPSVITLSLPAHRFAPGWAGAAGVLLGLGAHLANVLPDLEDDRATGVRGLPQQLGRTASVLVAPAALLVASALVVIGPAGSPAPLGWAGLALTTVLAVLTAAAALAGSRAHLPFRATIAIALVDVLLLIGSGSHLT